MDLSHIDTSYQAGLSYVNYFAKYQNLNFWQIKQKLLWLCLLLTWDLMWITSMGNHGVGWWGLGVSQNAGVLVVLVIIGIPWLEIGALLNLPLKRSWRGYTGFILYVSLAVCPSDWPSVYIIVHFPKPSRSIWWLKYYQTIYEGG